MLKRKRFNVRSGMVACWHVGMVIILILTADNDGVDVCSAVNPDNADEKAFFNSWLS
ncbi:hypothetical protein [Duffyella gerundensis]|uniref:hypothetical protein n=1 Tax=Duffyella TaxID=3026546 RepID=UPI003F6E2716